MAKKNILKEKSFAFAVRAVKLCQYLRTEKQEFVLSKQILRSGTSIGANIEEACGAQSDNDFIAKLHISLKEANESHYWIRLLQECDFITKNQGENVSKDISEIIAPSSRQVSKPSSKNSVPTNNDNSIAFLIFSF